MSDILGAILVAEIGSVTTRVTLIDIVAIPTERTIDGQKVKGIEQESRMIGRAETTSSVEPPYRNGLFGILEATAQISEATGRQLLRDGQLLMPQTSERDGVNHLVVTTSAAGTMTLIITAIASDVSARSAQHAARSTYTTVLQVVTLDDAADHPVSDDNVSWIERQVQALLSLQPDAVLIAGGLEGGAVEALNRLAHIVGLTALRSAVDANGQQRPDVTARPVLYAGNSAARERVLEALSDRSKIFIVDNVRPTLSEERLEPTRLELQRLYDELILARLPGMAALRRLSRVPVTTVCSVTGLMTRFIAERPPHPRQVLTLDVGSTSSTAFYASQGTYHPAVLGVCGTGYGLTTILTERGLANVSRWLPFPISDADLTHWMLNKVLRPQLIPSSREDLLIEQAITREALAMVLAALADEVPNPEYDLVVAGGGVLAHVPHPGMAALILLDALQSVEMHNAQIAQSSPLIDIHLDTLGLIPACGALARLDPDAAVTLFERDVLRNTPLATCVVVLGEARPEEVALVAELIVVGGRTLRVELRPGQLARLPLAPGQRAQLVLRPASTVRIGNSPPGVEVTSEVAAISGSVLGVVIDARGRPLRLADNPLQRCNQIWEWLVALGAEQGNNPYVEATGTEAAAIPLEIAHPISSGLNGNPPASSPAALSEVAKPGSRIALSELAAQEQTEQPSATGKLKPGSRISLSDLAAQEQRPPSEPPAAPGSLESDLAKLRQTFEEPKKRSWFGRKK